ncbi:MAG TPA: MerR family transcriptional regulator [Terriglobales bacterium]|nr:MerR family transcriptional regulator [Terriglobales bacterium]
MTTEGLTRGQLARASSVHPETIRVYERLGLLPPAARSPRGHRLFPVSAVEQLGLIRQARWLGFTLPEIHDLLAGPRPQETATIGPPSSWPAIEARIHQLEALRSALSLRLQRPKST